MTDQVLEILTELQSRMTALAADVAALRADIAPVRTQLDGLPVINRAVTITQRDVRALRDDIRVLTAIVMRPRRFACRLVAGTSRHAHTDRPHERSHQRA